MEYGCGFTQKTPEAKNKILVLPPGDTIKKNP
jgi:hypothetical protein